MECASCHKPVMDDEWYTEINPPGGYGRPQVLACDACIKAGKWDNSVTPSSGCIFCDIGLPTIKMKRQYIHRVDRGGWRTVVCSIKGIKPHEQARSNDAD